MPDSVRYGTLTASIIEVPDSVAKAWLDYLGEDSRLKEREFVELDQIAMINGQFHELVLYRSSTSYHIIINPDEV